MATDHQALVGPEEYTLNFDMGRLVRRDGPLLSHGVCPLCDKCVFHGDINDPLLAQECNGCPTSPVALAAENHMQRGTCS